MAVALCGCVASSAWPIFQSSNMGVCECSLASECANHLDGSTRSRTAVAVHGKITEIKRLFELGNCLKAVPW